MLNISQEQRSQLASVLVYVLILIGSPVVLAAARAENPSQQEATREQIVIDPLDEFRNVKTLDEVQLKRLLKAVGFEGKALRTAWAVAMKESNGRPKAHNDDLSTGDNSYGIFQINMLGELGADRREKFDLKTNKELLDPVTNAQIAYHMSNAGQDWSSWKVYPGQTNGERFEQFYALFPTI